MSKEELQELERKVYNFKTKYKEGFIGSEIESLIKDYPIDMNKFNDSLTGNTCIIRDGNLVQYHCDIYRAIAYGINPVLKKRIKIINKVLNNE